MFSRFGRSSYISGYLQALPGEIALIATWSELHGNKEFNRGSTSWSYSLSSLELRCYMTSLGGTCIFQLQEVRSKGFVPAPGLYTIVLPTGLGSKSSHMFQLLYYLCRNGLLTYYMTVRV